jgi:hypothetical protein
MEKILEGGSLDNNPEKSMALNLISRRNKIRPVHSHPPRIHKARRGGDCDVGKVMSETLQHWVDERNGVIGPGSHGKYLKAEPRTQIPISRL